MSKKNFKQECSEVVYDLMHSCYDELNLFCEIMGYPKSEVNRFIGEDPHGIADIMEGYRYFNMTDIHVVISEYERWMKIYKTNEELRKAVDAWYYWSLDWHEKHPIMEWVSTKVSLPYREPRDLDFINVLCADNESVFDSAFDFRNKKFWVCSCNGETEVKPNYWMRPTIPDDTHCPNLRSWLAGCPVEGLRDATLEWQTQREKDLQAAHQRVEECKQALEDAIKEEVKLNKF